MNTENRKFRNEKEISAGITAQADLSLGYVTAIVTDLVKDATLAKSVIDAVTAKFNTQKTAFVKAVTDERHDDCERDFTVDLTA